MTRQDVTLHDKFNMDRSPVLLNGSQALVRLMLMQKTRDRLAGLNTAGLVTGYRGSPLGAVDRQMMAAKSDLDAADIVFQEGLNEDLAATALWGAQQAELRGEGRFDGVFGLWYGKGPGVDRSGDALRHANMAGSSPAGGVVMAMGDDHTGESSTTLHQSDWAAVDAYIPVLSPAGVQEILDYGLYGFALSRFSGLWAGLKLMKDTVEVTSVVDGDPQRMQFVTPTFDGPPDGVNIRLTDTPRAQEARMVDHKKRAAEAFAHANRIDRRVWGKPGARIGFVGAGKNYLDLIHALNLLGIDQKRAERLGLSVYKVGQVWPLDMQGFREWAADLDLIVVVEEKRKLLEPQIKEAIFDDRRGRRVYGATRDGAAFLSSKYALSPTDVAKAIGEVLIAEGCDGTRITAAIGQITQGENIANAPDIAARTPYFCSGCPHNTSTKIPDGARAYAGIGCHYMVQWMDRDTLGYTHMGAEGANWIGEAPFSTRRHVFQNIGDGTYNHSGIQAIRAAVFANTTITYKILFNDAVALTGGQKNDGGLEAGQIAHEMVAIGVKNLAIVYDESEEIALADFPKHVPVYPRQKLIEIEDKLSKNSGVSVIIYVQTCAAEKRRRRKRGEMADPDKRVFINPDICEGCGDCGVQSNCVSVLPLDTEFGRKRMIDQSSCNKDFSCLTGFCPSFVTVSGGAIRRQATTDIDLTDLPAPTLPTIAQTHNIVVAGVGGTGVVTVGAVMAMAAHLDGKGVGMMEMAGLAQKGGAVLIHCRIADTPQDINAIRVAIGECDTLIGGDLVVSGGAGMLALMTHGRCGGVVNSHEIATGEFTRDPAFQLPVDALTLALQARLGQKLDLVNATDLAVQVMGDAIYSNMILLGAAWQRGLLPLSLDALTGAITLNGAAVQDNLRAFHAGRWYIACPDQAADVLGADPSSVEKTLDDKIAFRAAHLQTYQSEKLARRYRTWVDRFEAPEIKEQVALSYHKVLAYKDEYEVARLLAQTRAQAENAFQGQLDLTYHLAPPILSGRAENVRPKKRRFGRHIEKLFPLLARCKSLRGTAFDPFGYGADRRLERQMIAMFEADLDLLAKLQKNDPSETVLALAGWPLQVRGFGPVKRDNHQKAMQHRDTLLQMLQTGAADLGHAAE